MRKPYTKVGRRCDGSGEFIGYAETLSCDRPSRLVPNPAYVSHRRATCKHCRRVIAVANGKLARHDTLVLGSSGGGA